MLFNSNYQPAKLYAPASGTWRIQWYNMHPHTDRLERVQKTFKINRIKDVAERGRVAKNYVATINAALRKGYNYFTDTLGLKKVANEETAIHSIRYVAEKILTVRLIGIKKKRTRQSYTSYTNGFCEWLVKAAYNMLPAYEFTHSHWLEFMQYRESQGHGNRNTNDYTNYFKTSFKEAIPLGLLLKNPIEHVKFLPEADSSLFAEIKESELQRIKGCLLYEDPCFYLYTRFISDEYIRPLHLAYLKAGDIDYETDTIKTYGQSAKNNRINTKQLLPAIKKMLIKFGYHKLPGEWYLFGKGFVPSKDPYPTLSKRASERWKRLIIDGLKINKKMYALKHTSSTYYINENDHVDVAWLQKQMEHSSMAQTEIYIKERRTKKLNTKNIRTLGY